MHGLNFAFMGHFLIVSQNVRDLPEVKLGFLGIGLGVYTRLTSEIPLASQCSRTLLIAFSQPEIVGNVVRRVSKLIIKLHANPALIRN